MMIDRVVANRNSGAIQFLIERIGDLRHVISYNAFQSATLAVIGHQGKPVARWELIIR